jgi:hypothetical protein
MNLRSILQHPVRVAVTAVTAGLLFPADRAQTIIAFSPNVSSVLAAVVAGNVASAPEQVDCIDRRPRR